MMSSLTVSAVEWRGGREREGEEREGGRREVYVYSQAQSVVIPYRRYK